MPVNHDLDSFRRELRQAEKRLPEEVLKPLARYVGTRFAAIATGKYMRDAGTDAGPRSPNDSGPLRVVSTRLSRAVEGSFYQGRRESATQLRFIQGGIRWRRIIRVPYAAIHEEGGTIKQQVTESQRAFFWAMFYEASSEEERGRWKAMALSSELTIKIKARPYAGPAMEDVQGEAEERGLEMLHELVLDVVTFG